MKEDERKPGKEEREAGEGHQANCQAASGSGCDKGGKESYGAGRAACGNPSGEGKKNKGTWLWKTEDKPCCKEYS
jgi:hypothetical protein